MPAGRLSRGIGHSSHFPHPLEHSRRQHGKQRHGAISPPSQITHPELGPSFVSTCTRSGSKRHETKWYGNHDCKSSWQATPSQPGYRRPATHLRTNENKEGGESFIANHPRNSYKEPQSLPTPSALQLKEGYLCLYGLFLLSPLLLCPPASFPITSYSRLCFAFTGEAAAAAAVLGRTDRPTWNQAQNMQDARVRHGQPSSARKIKHRVTVSFSRCSLCRPGALPKYDFMPGFVRVEPEPGATGVGGEWFEWEIVLSRCVVPLERASACFQKCGWHRPCEPAGKQTCVLLGTTRRVHRLAGGGCP